MLSISNLKVCEWASEETNCFERILLWNGAKVGTASNEGHGGGSRVHWSVAGAKEAVEAYAHAMPEVDCGDGVSFVVTPDYLIDCLVENHLRAKERARILRKLSKGWAQGLRYYRLKSQAKGVYFIVKGGDAGLARSLVAHKSEPLDKVFILDEPDPFLDALLND